MWIISRLIKNSNALKRMPVRECDVRGLRLDRLVVPNGIPEINTVTTGPLEELADDFIYRLRMGDRPHVAEILELHDLNLRQCGRE